MAVYHRSHFDDVFMNSYLNVCLSNNTTRVSDDLYISNYLALRNVMRMQVGAPWVSRQRMWSTGCILDHGVNDPNALHKLSDEGNKRYRKSRRFLKSKGLLAKELDFKTDN